ncbi:YheC/YheD family endospore coat-associated protein [Bacillus timonensis]|uniref:YheC/YheD family endospore coat-associated protein n=1 Tax=Bacillus timonensis TaxID=1033734 RepID=UPI0002892186|nr:YheC/YheD family protein [Bacillus timonensis]
MISLGFVTLYPNQELGYATELAKRAPQFGIQVYRFSPTSIEPGTEMIRGEKYNHASNTWERNLYEIPMYLYDRCFYSNDEVSKKSQPIMNWLKMRPGNMFLGQGLPSKWEIYNVLSQDEKLSPYIPSTEQALSSSAILRALMKQHQIMLKPEKGSMGKGIIGLFLHQNHVEVAYKEANLLKKKQFTTRGDLKKWIDAVITTQPYLSQIYLPLHDEENRPFDIRILLQKGENGKWFEQGRGIRLGLKDHLISNLGGGGKTHSFESWTENLPFNQKKLLEDNIHTIINKLPDVLEEKFSPLFELGVDLGLTRDGAIWILDTNSKPGRKVILETSPTQEESLYTTPLQYCLHLHST